MFTFIQIKLLQIWQTTLIALRALRRNKMRSMLTALGIIIGVASVVAMVAVGNGAQARITSQVSALGQNLLTVFAGSKKSGGVNSGLGSASAITLADAEAIQREVPDVAAVSPEVSVTAQAIPDTAFEIDCRNGFHSKSYSRLNPGEISCQNHFSSTRWMRAPSCRSLPSMFS